MTVPIVGRRQARPVVDQVTDALCVDRPELIPPQDWFDHLRVLLEDPRQLFADPPTARDVLIVTNTTVGPLYADKLAASLAPRRCIEVELPDGRWALIPLVARRGLLRRGLAGRAASTHPGTFARLQPRGDAAPRQPLRLRHPQ